MNRESIITIVQKYRFSLILKSLDLRHNIDSIESVLIALSDQIPENLNHIVTRATQSSSRCHTALIIRYKHKYGLIEFGYKDTFYIAGKTRIQIQDVNGTYMYDMQKKYLLDVNEQQKLMDEYANDTESPEWLAIKFFQKFNTVEKIKQLMAQFSLEPLSDPQQNHSEYETKS